MKVQGRQTITHEEVAKGQENTPGGDIEQLIQAVKNNCKDIDDLKHFRAEVNVIRPNKIDI